MEIPFTAHAVEIEENRKNASRYKKYYEANKDKMREYNRKRYEEKKGTFTPEEIAKRRQSNRRSYYKKRDLTIKEQLEAMKKEGREDRVALLDEILTDNDYAHWGKETLKVVAFLVGKKETPSS
jgi:hypothetical protein